MSRIAQRYAKELLKLCAEKEHEEVERIIERFAKLLIERGQTHLLSEITEAVKTAPEPGSVEVTLTTAIEPEEGDLSAFHDQLEKKLGLRVHLQNTTDPNILGGTKVRYRDTLFDGTLRGRLDSLKQQLSQ